MAGVALAAAGGVGGVADWRGEAAFTIGVALGGLAAGWRQVRWQCEALGGVKRWRWRRAAGER